jgi:hypothetical protein
MKTLGELLIYPLIVGLTVAFFTFVLPLLSQKRKKLQYEIEQPISYLRPDKIGNLEIKINGIDTKELSSYTVKLKNTGDISIKDLEVLYSFDQPEKDFKILSEYHKTKPAFEFGKIERTYADSISEKFLYGLFNTSDEATLTIFTTKNATLNVYAKQEDLSFSKAEATPEANDFEKWPPYLQFGAIVLAVISSLLTKFLDVWPFSKRNKTQSKD